MKLGTHGNLRVTNKADPDGEIELEIKYKVNGGRDVVSANEWVDRDAAIKLVKHLCDVFDLPSK